MITKNLISVFFALFVAGSMGLLLILVNLTTQRGGIIIGTVLFPIFLRLFIMEDHLYEIETKIDKIKNMKIFDINKKEVKSWKKK